MVYRSHIDYYTMLFTGIIQGIGRVQSISPSDRRSVLCMDIDLGGCAEGLEQGHSVAINGVCLTVVDIHDTRCTFEMIQETVQTTGLRSLKAGDSVNIERSLRVGDKIEGHFVLGHVDGTGVIDEIQERPGEVSIKIRVPETLSRYIVKKGSIAIDGTSLTITDIQDNMIQVSLIPHTMEVTNFGTRQAGDIINIETDILGKYVLKVLL